MSGVMATIALKKINRAQLERGADGLAAAIAASHPSTRPRWRSASSIGPLPYNRSVKRFCLFLALAVASAAFALATHEGNDPFPAYRIMDNLYYVGTEDIASYLIVTPKGHFLRRYDQV